jgi:hypothetical protein
VRVTVRVDRVEGSLQLLVGVRAHVLTDRQPSSEGGPRLEDLGLGDPRGINALPRQRWGTIDGEPRRRRVARDGGGRSPSLVPAQRGSARGSLRTRGLSTAVARNQHHIGLHQIRLGRGLHSRTQSASHTLASHTLVPRALDRSQTTTDNNKSQSITVKQSQHPRAACAAFDHRTRISIAVACAGWEP